MEPLIIHRGIAAPLHRSNIDTDQIIPKQFLKRVERTGFGQFLFYDWRFDEEGRARADFLLNQAPYNQASILIAGSNFGCGSSREHAPWALKDFGFRVIIAPSFADIFYNNCFKNGILPLTLPPLAVEAIVQAAGSDPHQIWTVDVQQQTVVNGDHSLNFSFDLDPYRRHTLLEGLDDIARTLAYAEDIAQFEAGQQD
ncbi:MAG: 3-isopropylmalate dehydratase small subunit [Firmicutes bacterium]|nr:3-isopropylmalate dehydratase small subunit [Bacillota bacterium]